MSWPGFGDLSTRAVGALKSIGIDSLDNARAIAWAGDRSDLLNKLYRLDGVGIKTVREVNREIGYEDARRMTPALLSAIRSVTGPLTSERKATEIAVAVLGWTHGEVLWDGMPETPAAAVERLISELKRESPPE